MLSDIDVGMYGDPQLPSMNYLSAITEMRRANYVFTYEGKSLVAQITDD